MADALKWRQADGILFLEGCLDRDSLLPLWQQRNTLLPGSRVLDVGQVERVDSSGLALLVHFYHQQEQNGSSLEIAGASDRLRTLIQLYNLNEIIPVRSTD
ncbi:lipid asymmetry maintenance protein MlaB [Dickeya chrysanthemi]|uniref:Lipid asymmetry maintenance protein MlaB n=1 Tax=Dickeya chrysanthemi TaxID=556 RepID=A0ABU8JM74_DICCH|nr:lipid asymmetry maintenance protein MlaB [Dickeya chrysanthemi]MBX9446698.1 lipid asymmetry maintenance protein MlaB [Dickeya chrysanthemi]MCA7007328.1 lipid asymmetry maintenance protein MlaB [Dickeya chrysanthemi]